jgi:hypothetical protein
MKEYQFYSETSYKGDWPEFFKGYKYSEKDRGRIQIEYVSFCNKKDMIEIIGERIHSKHWVKERVSSDMGNEKLCKICDENKGYIVVVMGNCGKDAGKIIAKIPIKRKEA